MLTTGTSSLWYNDSSYFVNSSYPWFYRSGYYSGGTGAGLYYFNYGSGGVSDSTSARAVLIEFVGHSGGAFN